MSGRDTFKDLMDLVLPRVERRPSGGEPLRHGIDHRTSSRKTVLIDSFPGFSCDRCGTWSMEKSYDHPAEECAVAQVMLS